MKKENVGSVKVIPLGGLEQIGMNITAIEYGLRFKLSRRRNAWY